ncbi:MAG: hypothetical protein WCK42_07305 [Myxococcaceae bacterium]
MDKYIKKVLSSLLILMIPYMNTVSNAVNDENYDGSTIRTHQVSFRTEDPQDVLSSVKQSTSSQFTDLKYSTTSWVSYMTSPIKATMRIVNEFASFATNHPKSAVIIGMYSLINVANATMWCVCAGPGDNCAYSVGGQVPSCAVCPNVCAASQYHSQMCSCSSYPPTIK